MTSETTRLWAAESELERIHHHAQPLIDRWRDHVGEPEAMADLGLVLHWAADQIEQLQREERNQRRVSA